MRVIVIDAVKQEVREEETGDKGFLQYLYATIGCTCVDVVRVTARHDLWCDDEGLFANGGSPKHWTLIKRPGVNGVQQIAGTLVLAEHDNEGNSISTTTSIEDVHKMLLFGFLLVPEGMEGDAGFSLQSLDGED